MKSINPFATNAYFDDDSRSDNRSVSPDPSQGKPNNLTNKNTRINTANTSVINGGEANEKDKFESYILDDAVNPSPKASRSKPVPFKEPVYEGLANAAVIDSSSLLHPVILYDDGFYFGILKGKRPDGYGLFMFNSGDVYVGQWNEGVPDQYGYLYFIEGGFYFGEISKGFANGRGLLFRKHEDFYYEGSFVNGFMEGKGYLNLNGIPYDCLVKSNKIIYTQKRSAPFKTVVFPQRVQSFSEEFYLISLYTNPETFQNLNRNYSDFVGSAKSDWESVFIGERTEHGEKEGVGTVLISKGGRFHGMFNKNMSMGLGISVDKQSDVKLGLFSKKGIQVFGSCSIEKDHYIGGFKDGMYEGPGLYYDSEVRRWIIGFFKENELATKAFYGHGRLQKGQVSLNHKILEKILEKTFGDHFRLNQGLGCLVLSGRSAKEVKKNDPSVADVENKFFLQKLTNYLAGNSTPKEDHRWWLANGDNDTRDMAKEVFTGYLKNRSQGTSVGGKTGQDAQKSNLYMTDAVSNDMKISQQKAPKLSFADIEKQEDQFSFEPRNRSKEAFSNSKRSDKLEIKNPNFDFLQDL